MTTNHDDERLDWHTYEVLRQVVRAQRMEYIAEYDKPSTTAERKWELLALRMAMTDLQMAMGDRMMPITNEGEEKKDS